MKIAKSVKKAMDTLGVDNPRRNQIRPVNAIRKGHDTMVIAPTSFGKSLIYLIPALIRTDAITIVIEPLLALMHDQVSKLISLGISAACLDSTQSRAEREQVIENIRNREIHILYIAPERLETGILSLVAEHNHIGMIVVDECHCVTAWGGTFREAYLSIGSYIARMDYHPVIVALSATIPKEDRERVMDLLSMRNPKCFEMKLYRSNLVFLKASVSSRKEQRNALRKYMRKYHRHTTIVFCNTRKAVEAVAAYLDSLYPGEVICYHSRNKKHEREMLSGEKHIIAATSALSLGVDIPGVDLVIHFNMPMSLAEYSQMAGRGGREGQRAHSILLYHSDDYYTNRAMLTEIENSESRKHALELLDAMKEFCEDGKDCMVRSMLNALGDSHTGECRYCTNCQKNKRGINHARDTYGD